MVDGNQIRAAAQAGINLGRTRRCSMMNAIGRRYGIPSGGFSRGQSRLFRNQDIRLLGLLRRLDRPRVSRAVAANLIRASELVPEINSSLVLTTSARENHRSPAARGSIYINTFHEGGLDFLWPNRNRLGLPRNIVRNWRFVTPFRSKETKKMVYPAEIPARDQVPAYAAQTRSSFNIFKNLIRKELGNDAGDSALNTLNNEARSVWQAYSFLAPGGRSFDYTKTLRYQHGQKFGIKTAIGYLQNKAWFERRPLNLNEIITDPHLNGTDYIRIAKTRAAEATFYDNLLKSVLPGTSWSQ